MSDTGGETKPVADQLSPGGRATAFDVAGQRVAALQAGPEDGTPVLLLPGYTGSKEDFAPLLRPLGDAGLRVTAIDLPGQYESAAMPDAGGYTPDRLGAVVVALAQRLGPRVQLLGHSFGGLVARAAAIAAPDRFASLVLLCSGPAQIGGGRRAAIERLEPLLSATGLAGVYAATQNLARTEPGYVAPAPELAAFLERRFLAGSAAMLQGMGDVLRGEPDRVAELAAADLPTLVVHGADDNAWAPTSQQDMARRLGAGYVVIPDAAHSPAVENPAALVDTLLPFWRARQPLVTE